MVGTSQNEEEFGLEYLDKLTFSDDTFSYKTDTFQYTDIEHLEYTAVSTKRSINFVPAGTSYDARLYLHLSNGQRLHIQQEPRVEREA